MIYDKLDYRIEHFGGVGDGCHDDEGPDGHVLPDVLQLQVRPVLGVIHLGEEEQRPVLLYLTARDDVHIYSENIEYFTR